MVQRNSAEELADALAKLATDPALRAEIGHQGLESFRANYTWETIRLAYRQILRRAPIQDKSAVAGRPVRSYA